MNGQHVLPRAAGQTWTNAKTFGARGDNTSDDTAAIQAALDSLPDSVPDGGAVHLPAGVYRTTGPLLLPDRVRLVGDGDGATVLAPQSTTTPCLTGTDIDRLTISGVWIEGVGSGTAHGIDLALDAAPHTGYVSMSDVTVAAVGGDGIRIENPIVTTLNRVICQTAGGWGFNLHGQPAGAAGTSTTLTSCYANDCATGGYRLFQMVYTSLVACAADNNPVGYLVEDGAAITLTGCGAEGCNVGLRIDGTNNATATGFYTYATPNAGTGIHITGNASRTTLLGCRETEPAVGATSHITTDSGTSTAILGCVGATPNSLTGGTVTTYIDSQVAVSKAGAANVLIDNFGGVAVLSNPLAILGAGNGLRVSEGSNAKMGTAALTAGTATVATTAVNANSRIFLTCQTPAGTPGFLRVSARVAGTSFTITSSSGTDTSTAAWMIIDPA